MWVPPKIRVLFWYPKMLCAVIYSKTKGAHDFEDNQCGNAMAFTCPTLPKKSKLKELNEPTVGTMKS